MSQNVRQVYSFMNQIRKNIFWVLILFILVILQTRTVMAKSVEFILDKENNTYNFSATYVNTQRKGNIIIKKYGNSEKIIPLEDVTFEIRDDNNALVTTVMTNEKGEAEVTGLPLGKYTLVETKTKEEYRLLKESIDITIPYIVTAQKAEENDMDTSNAIYCEKDDSWYWYDQTIEVINHKKFFIPNTGIFNVTNIIVMIGVLLTCGGLACIIYKNKEKC